MADTKNHDVTVEDDYDEEQDSDFDDGKPGDENLSSSSADEEIATEDCVRGQPRKRRKMTKGAPVASVVELDSGDEATTQECEKTRRKLKGRSNDVDFVASDTENEGWRARTRAMRERDKMEKKGIKSSTARGSTVNVDKLWEDMNKPKVPAAQPPLVVQCQRDNLKDDAVRGDTNGLSAGWHGQSVESEDQENDHSVSKPKDEMITIRRTYQYAGKVHTEQKEVARSSAEARLWLSQGHLEQPWISAMDRPLRRPLRKISRFDPNLNDLGSYQKHWERLSEVQKVVTGPKLNTVEKSKMDWAAHVDQEGLKDELEEHAKAKGGYLGRMDFLGQVERRREEEIRHAQVRG